MPIFSFLKYNLRVVRNIAARGQFSGKMLADDNEINYEKEEVVQIISQRAFLFKPERIALNILRNQLPNMKMLDIGIGGGRTTAYFAALTKEYIGIDYSQEMIRTCQRKFKEYPKKIIFARVDARNMTLFRDGEFDFVLFSFNGIDCVDHADRIKILREIQRVTKNRGYFLFSSHNLNSLQGVCSVSLSSKPSKFAQNINEISRLLFLRLTNKCTWKIIRTNPKKLQYVIFNDGSYEFGLELHYIDPEEQLKDLKALGFKNVKVYGMNDDCEVQNPTSSNDYGLHYFCEVQKT
ncbi:MAG: class I SAM-dependent methyltransferase [Candidatus Bathyarchaeia archaeon]